MPVDMTHPDIAAERRGAERMKEACALRAVEAANQRKGNAEAWHSAVELHASIAVRQVADAIRATPLPGDDPHA